MPRFVLPKTVQARNWVRATDTLRASLVARKDELKKKADELRSQADHTEQEMGMLDAAIEFIDQLLPPKPSKPAELPAGAQPASQVQAPVGATIRKRWSLNHDACIRCGRGPAQGVRHASQGMCQVCYWRERHPKTEPQTDASVVEAAGATNGV